MCHSAPSSRFVRWVLLWPIHSTYVYIGCSPAIVTQSAANRTHLPWLRWNEIFDHHKRTLKQKPSSIWIFELINKIPRTITMDCANQIFSNSPDSNRFFLLHLYSPSFDLVLSLIVLIELICPHFIVRATVAARHITSMHVSDWNVFTQQSMLLLTYFIFFSPLPLSVPGVGAVLFFSCLFCNQVSATGLGNLH